MAVLPAGTQCSQKPQRSTPALPWAKTLNSGSAEAAVPATAARRPARRDRRKSVMLAFLPAGGLGAASLAKGNAKAPVRGKPNQPGRIS